MHTVNTTYIMVTRGGTEIRFYDSKLTKESLKQWHVENGAVLKELKVQQSVGKVMTTIFWESHPIVLRDYKLEGEIMTGKQFTLTF